MKPQTGKTRIAALGLLVATALGPPAVAQMAHTQLLGFFTGRPLHERLGDADAAVIADVAAVELGRIHLKRAVPLFGEVDSTSLVLKRAPSNPPPLEPGERALLLLRGARPPYVLADDFDEIMSIDDSDMEFRWTHAVKDLHAALSKPGEMTARYLAWVYLSWLNRPEEDLRWAAVLGLGDRGAPFQPLTADLVEELIRTASETGLDFELRRAAAFVAGRSVADQPELAAARPSIQRNLDQLNIELRD